VRAPVEPPVVLEIAAPEAGLTGWLAVDSVLEGHFCGGLRMLPDVSAPELAALARAMTLKHGFLGMPHGGAKAGILCGEEEPWEKRIRLLAAFGRRIKDLLVDRAYLPGPDMGTSVEDIRSMLEAVGVPVPRRALRGRNSGWYTSLTVIAAARAAAAAQGIALEKATVAIEGFGAVGGAVAQGLAAMGSRVVAVSTRRGALHAPAGLDVAGLLRASQAHGSRLVDHYRGDADRIEKEALLELEADVLVPCARHHSIHKGNAGRIRARAVSCGANVPATEEAEKILAGRGILCVPDFVANAGGVLGGTMEFAGVRPRAIAELIDTRFSRQVSLLIDRARREGAFLRDAAEKTAMGRFARMRDVSGTPTFRSKAFSIGLGLYRNGLIPAALVGVLAVRYFERRLEGRFCLPF
jgi:glutamate dehydrogenase (NAD(P)+)